MLNHWAACIRLLGLPLVVGRILEQQSPSRVLMWSYSSLLSNPTTVTTPENSLQLSRASRINHHRLSRDWARRLDTSADTHRQAADPLLVQPNRTLTAQRLPHRQRLQGSWQYKHLQSCLPSRITRQDKLTTYIGVHLVFTSRGKQPPATPTIPVP